MDVEIAADGVARRSVEDIIGFAVVCVNSYFAITWEAIDGIGHIPKSARGAADRDKAYMMAYVKKWKRGDVVDEMRENKGMKGEPRWWVLKRGDEIGERFKSMA